MKKPKYLVYHKFYYGHDCLSECKLFTSKKELDRYVKSIKKYHNNDTERLVVVKIADVCEDYTKPPMKLTKEQEETADKVRKEFTAVFSGDGFRQTMEELILAELKR